jgi:hypothetical protein
MPDVIAKDCFEMMTAENERPVETLFSDGPYPALRDRVRPRRSHRCLDHFYAFAGEHLVEAGGELGVAVSDQEPERPSVLGEIACEVAGNLVTKEPVGLSVTPRMCTTRLWSSMTNSAQSWLRPIVSTTKKSVAKMPLAWAVRNCF